MCVITSIDIGTLQQSVCNHSRVVRIDVRMSLLQAGVRGRAQWGLWIWGAHPWRCPLYLMTQVILVLVLVTHKVG